MLPAIEFTRKDGTRWRRLLSEDLVLTDSGVRLAFHVRDEELKFETTLAFVFSDEGDRYSANAELTDEGKLLTVTLNKWVPDGAEFIENVDPMELTIGGNRTLHLKYRTHADLKRNWRTFQITIWVQIT